MPLVLRSLDWSPPWSLQVGRGRVVLLSADFQLYKEMTVDPRKRSSPKSGRMAILQ